MIKTEGELAKRIMKLIDERHPTQTKTCLKNSIEMVLDEALSDLLKHGEFSECEEPDGTATPIFVVERATWERWFGIQVVST